MASTATLEKRSLIVVTVLTITGFILFLICVATNQWSTYDFPYGYYDSNSKEYLISGHSGFWTVCTVKSCNVTSDSDNYQECRMRYLFPTESQLTLTEVDTYIVHYYRTQSGFAITGLCLMILGHLFAVYSLRQSRYMYKRVVGCLHIMSAASILVCAEVLRNTLEYERINLKRYPPGTSFSYGFSFILCWFTFAFYLIAGIIFFICSRKKKGSNATTDTEATENEPVRLGRV